MKRLKNLVKIALSLAFIGAVVFLIVKKINLNDAYISIQNLSLSMFLGMVLMALLLSLSKAVRFFLLCKKSHLTISFWEAIKIFFASQSTTFLPGGEIMRIMLLKMESGKNPIKATGPVVSQGLLELVSGIVIVVIGTLFFPALFAATFIMLVILCGLSLFIFNPDWSKKFLSFVARGERTKSYAANIIKVQEETRGIFFSDPKKDNTFLISIFGISLFSHIIGGLFIYFISFAIGSTVSLPFSIFLYASSVVIGGILAIIPGGLGVTEGGMLGLLQLGKIAFTPATLLVLIFRFWTLLFPTFLGILLLIIFYGKTLIFRRGKLLD